MNASIPLVDIAAQQREIADEIAPGIEGVIASGNFIGGRNVADFESAYARYVGVRHCVGVANGTDALEIALRAAGVRAGGEVILPANTFIATAEAVSRIGATPVLVDVDDEYLLIDPAEVGAATTSRTQAVIPVHLYGQTVAVEHVAKVLEGTDAVIVEDAAQSQGARRNGVDAGRLGRIAGTSFYPGKNLGAAGDAGAVVTDDDVLARTARLLGNHGSERKYEHESIGFNSRLDAIQAVVLSAKLRRLEEWNQARREAAARYDRLLAGLEHVRRPSVMPGNEPVWHLYVVRVPDRDAVVRRLNAKGIGAAIHYPTPIHRTCAYRALGRQSFPVSESAAHEILSLPLHPHITERQQVRVAEALQEALSSH
jgi:dTDP-4-amino-4,6-dideoxygalactose transaminase